jgi:hypothetical protein
MIADSSAGAGRFAQPPRHARESCEALPDQQLSSSPRLKSIDGFKHSAVGRAWLTQEPWSRSVRASRPSRHRKRPRASRNIDPRRRHNCRCYDRLWNANGRRAAGELPLLLRDLHSGCAVAAESPAASHVEGFPALRNTKNTKSVADRPR